MTIDARLVETAEAVGGLLRDRGATVAVAEGSCGGLISAALLGVSGASAYYVGGTVIYTRQATRALLAPVVEPPRGVRGATEEFALYLARSVRTALATTWGVGEGGAAGPSGNPYGDPPGHAWVAVAGPIDASQRLATGSDDRRANMTAFATAALELLRAQLQR